MPVEPPPQLFLHKPSKAQIKQAKAKGGSAPPPHGRSPSASSMDPSSSSPSSSAAAELKPKKPFLRRIFPFLLIVNFAVGAYVLLRTTDKQPAEKDEEVLEEKEAAAAAASAPAGSPKLEVPQPIPVKVAEAPKKVLPPIPQEEQREIFKWILEEKRKIKPESSSEKKKLDEEKALLKQFIRAKSIPTL